MFEYRHTVTIGVFIAFNCAVCLWALRTGESGAPPVPSRSFSTDRKVLEKLQVSTFSRAEYYLLEGERPKFHLLADALETFQDNQEVSFERPRGNFFADNGQTVDYQAESGVLKQAQKHLDLEGEVVLSSKDFQISSQSLKYDLGEHQISASGEVDGRNIYWQGKDRISLKGEKATFWPHKKRARYEGKVEGVIERKLAYQSNLHFGAGLLDFDRLEEKISAEGHLWIQKRGVRARGRRGEIYLETPPNSTEKGKKLKYFVLYDDVRVMETVKTPRGKTFTRQAFCEQLEGGFDGQAIVLTGNPRVVQSEGVIEENSVIRGKQIILRENSEVVEIDDANTRFGVGP